MNINFHYYAIKAIARSAGFEPADAQIIAEYSQFVDDYTTSGAITISNPAGAGYAAANALNMIRQDGANRITDSVQTGFAGLDYLWSLGDKFQNKTIVPFHFIPSLQLAAPIYHNPTVPAVLGDGSVISVALNTAMNAYRQNLANPQRYLVQLGVLLHVFADTYAHQRFNGHWDGMFHRDTNSYYIDSAWKNTAYGARGNDVTSEYTSVFFKAAPAVGHATAGHTPDDTDITFALHHRKNAALNYVRDNTVTFADTALEIYKILFRCKTGGEPTVAQCDALKARLLPGFLVKNGTEPSDVMLHAWAGAFDEFGFAYDKTHVAGRLFTNINFAEFENSEGKVQVLDSGENPYQLLFDQERQIKSMTATLSDEYYWFAIAAYVLRSQAVSQNYLT